MRLEPELLLLVPLPMLVPVLLVPFARCCCGGLAVDMVLGPCCMLDLSVVVVVIGGRWRWCT